MTTTIPECPPTPCREWQGGRTRGYGVKTFNGRKRLVHRWVYSRLHGGFRGIHGRVVMHLCDNRACFRYDHLFLGTLADNNRDMMQKQRHRFIRYTGPMPHGEAHTRAKLTERDVREIRQQWATGEWTGPQLAAEFGISVPTLRHIYRGHTWRHLRDEDDHDDD